MHCRAYVYLIFSNLFMAVITGSSYPLWQPLSLFRLIAGFMPVFVLSDLTLSLCGHCFGRKGGGSGWRTSKSQLLERSLGFWNDLRWSEAHFLRFSDCVWWARDTMMVLSRKASKISTSEMGSVILSLPSLIGSGILLHANSALPSSSPI